MTTPDPKLLKRALGWLARREYARSELRAKLVRLGGNQEAIEPVLEHLSATGAQSDRRFTGEYIRARIRRGEGPLKIVHTLEARGISRELIETELHRPDAAWILVAERARIKRFGSSRPSDVAMREQQSHFLLQRGFSPRVVSGLWQGWGLDILSDAGEGRDDDPVL
ncbi:MAG: regulatory protein RecX [Gammaproteobacteria bacterium]